MQGWYTAAKTGLQQLRFFLYISRPTTPHMITAQGEHGARTPCKKNALSTVCRAYEMALQTHLPKEGSKWFSSVHVIQSV